MPQLLSLPPEIVSEIIILLSRKDLGAFSLLSLAARQFAIPLLFCNVTVHLWKRVGSIEKTCDKINGAGDQIKHAVK